MGLGTLTLLSMLWATGQAKPEAMPFNTRQITLPINYKQEKGDIKSMVLFVSANQGTSWDPADTASPDKNSFSYNAPADGSYWFIMQLVDKAGRKDPPDVTRADPQLKLLIDTMAPVVTIRSVDRIHEDVLVDWAIQELNPKWDDFHIDYRMGTGPWMPVEVRSPNLTGLVRFKPIGTGPITVRVHLSDIAGNKAEAIKAESSKEVGGELRVTSGLTPVPPDSVPPPLSEIPPIKSEPAGPPSPLPVAAPPSASEAVNIVKGSSLPAPYVINVAKFDLAGEVEGQGSSGVSKAEIWVTQDDGRSWRRLSETNKIESSLSVDLSLLGHGSTPPAEGIYGIKVVLYSGANLTRGTPVAGDLPDMRVHLDMTAPIVRIRKPVPHPIEKDTLILTWEAIDQNLATDPITIEYSESMQGPWQPVALAEGSNLPRRLPNSKDGFSWKIPPGLTAPRVYLRIAARDTAGNIGVARTEEPVTIDVSKPAFKPLGINPSTQGK